MALRKDGCCSRKADTCPPGTHLTCRQKCSFVHVSRSGAAVLQLCEERRLSSSTAKLFLMHWPLKGYLGEGYIYGQQNTHDDQAVGQMCS